MSSFHVTWQVQLMFGIRLAQDDEDNQILEFDFGPIVLLYSPYE